MNDQEVLRRLYEGLSFTQALYVQKVVHMLGALDKDKQETELAKLAAELKCGK